jgi:hypothetical protein
MPQSRREGKPAQGNLSEWNPDIQTVDSGGPVKQGASRTMTTKPGHL